MRLPSVSLLAVAMILSACSVGHSRKPVPQVQQPRQVIHSDSEISGIAEREILRRQDQILRADEAAIQSHQRMSDGDLEGAVQGYRSAVSELENP